MRSYLLEDSLICETSMCPTAMRQGPPWSAASLTADIDVTCIHARARQPFQSCRSMARFEMTTLLAQTHLATVGMCRCLSSGLPVALKMYHRDRLTPKMESQANLCHHVMP